MRRNITRSPALFLAIGLLIMAQVLFAAGDGEQPATAAAEGGADAGSIREAPMLAAMVSAGQIPPLEERLPEEPKVLEPRDAIGRYGGTIRFVSTGANVFNANPTYTLSGFEGMFHYAPDYTTIEPNLATSWEYSEDGTTFTVRLRRGVKWSDGAPFDAADIMFWYSDVMRNEQLTPAVPTWLKAGGEVADVRQLDDYTVQFSFASPYPLFHHQLTVPNRGMIYAPSHYMQQLHPDYAAADKLSARVKEEGFDEWWQLFSARVSFYMNYADRPEETPTLRAYYVKRVAPKSARFERNAYYWKVDTAGQQLPYVDFLQALGVEDPEVGNVKILNGEVDYADAVTALRNYPLYRNNEQQGGYRVILWPSAFPAGVGLFPNQTHKDPALRAILQDVNFRIALSHAIDRDEINELVYLGLGKPMSPTVLPEASPLYREEFAQAHVAYDPDLANRLLDEMGLKWDADRTFRIGPDGGPLTLRITYANVGSWGIRRDATNELVKKYWEAVGVRTILDPNSSPLFVEKVRNNDHDIGVWNVATPEARLYWLLRDYVPTQFWTQWGSEWAKWFNTDGADGEAPPPKVKRLMDLHRVSRTSMDPAERQAALLEILESMAENRWVIGTVGVMPQPVIVNAKLRNVPDNLTWVIDYNYGKIGRPTTWFYGQ